MAVENGYEESPEGVPLHCVLPGAGQCRKWCERVAYLGHFVDDLVENLEGQRLHDGRRAHPKRRCRSSRSGQAG